ncbi:MAG TPA: glycine betaine ABC transporter substrate-binding protein [Thermoleophilaceae bacterium]
MTIGSKNFTEQFILGQLYAQALKAKGYTVSLKQNIGSSEIIDKALTSDKIDMYPEYVGIILTAVAHETAKPKSADDAYQQAKKFEEGRGFTVLDKTPFSNVDAMGVTKAFAQKNGLTTVTDLKKLSSFRLGGPPEFKTRDTGVVGLKKDYGLDNIKFVPLAIGLQYKALDSGKVDAADVFTTDGQLQGGKYTVLKDLENTFGFQNVAPVVSQKVLSKEGTEFSKILNDVSAKLTVEAMRKMNAAVDLDKQEPASVAQQFLSANGLV